MSKHDCPQCGQDMRLPADAPADAPDLVARVRAEVVTYPSSAVWPRAELQLRALLAVAKAARLLATDPDVENNDESAGYLVELNRALDRLNKASGGR